LKTQEQAQQKLVNNIIHFRELNLYLYMTKSRF